MRVPFFLLLGFNKGTQKDKGKRILLGNLVNLQSRGCFKRLAMWMPPGPPPMIAIFCITWKGRRKLGMPSSESELTEPSELLSS